MKKNNYLSTVIIAVLFFLAITYSMVFFNTTVNYELEKSVRTTLSDLADQQRNSLSRELASMIFNLTTFSETLPIIGIDEQGIIEYVQEKQEALHFETVLVIDKDGLAFLPTIEFADVSKEEFFLNAYRGENYVSETHISDFTGNEVITFSVPIYVDGKIDGVLAVEYNTDYLDTLLTTFTDVRGLNLVLNNDSEILLSTNSFVISFDAFVNAKFDEGTTFESVLDDFENGRSGSISYNINEENKFGEYRTLSQNDWVLFFEMSEENMITSVRTISYQMILISLLIVICALVTISYVIISKNNSQKELEKVAYYDEMTNIPNLIRFKMLVAQALQENPLKEFAIVKFDIVNFKAINEMFGFEAGNKIIRTIAQVGTTVKNDTFIQGRIGGDEFILFAEKSVFSNLKTTSKNYENTFLKLLPEFEEHKFNFRYGRYYLKPLETDVNDVVNKVNIAHSFAKKDNTSNIWDYDEDFTKKVLRDTELSNKMNKALEKKEYKLFLQPKYNVVTGKICGSEALVRWVEKDENIIYPNEFIPLFERNGFIVELDYYMLHSVCEAIKGWQEAGKKIIPVSINFSRLHLRNDDFVQEIHEIVKSYGIDTGLLEIELTESTVMENEKTLASILKELHKAGFLVSIDDFGSGYSSLGMLKNFEVDTLKLDRSFFIEIESEDEHNRGNVVVSSIVDLAGKLGMYTVAEGIEEKYQEEFLKKIKCDAAQGFYFARPMPLSEFDKRYYN